MRVIFMGTPDFAVPTLEALEKEHEVSLVISQEDKQRGRGKKMMPPPVKAKALELGLDVYQPKDINSKESIERIKQADPDIIVVVAYGQILSEEILNLPKYKCLNVHASLLPKYRGAAPLNWVVINGEEKTGVTIMEMSKGLDTGDMLSKCELIIDRDMTAGEVHDHLMEDGSDLLIKTLRDLEQGRVDKEPQDHDESTYAPMMDKKLGEIDWSKSAEDIRNLVRGTFPWPGAYFKYDDKNVKLLEAEVTKGKIDEEAGKVIEVSKDEIIINTGKDALVLKKIQFPGKKAVSVEDYLRGNEFKENIILT